jgi:hypothetical protein
LVAGEATKLVFEVARRSVLVTIFLGFKPEPFRYVRRLGVIDQPGRPLLVPTPPDGDIVTTLAPFRVVVEDQRDSLF